MNNADYITEGISARIKQERRIRNMTQEDVIARIDDEIAVSTLSRYELNNLNMTVTTLAKIAQALDVSVGDLLCDAENFMASREAAKFIFYYPLIPRDEILDSIRRIGGLYYGHESYVDYLLHRMVEQIPDSPAKKWADFNVCFRPIAIQYLRTYSIEEGAQIIRSCPDVMALFGSDSPDFCYKSYLKMLDKSE